MSRKPFTFSGRSFPTTMIPLEEVDVRSFRNSRTTIRPSEVEDLVDSIKRRGLLQPPIVRRKTLELIDLQERKAVPGDPEKAYEVIAGFQRVLALMRIYNETRGEIFFEVPVGMADVDDHEARLINLSENLHRRNLAFQDESEALYELEQSGLRSQDIAEKLGVKRSWVAQRVSFRKHAEAQLVRVVEDQILPFSRAYQIFRQLGGSKPSRTDREAQRKVAKAAVQANIAYMGRVDQKLETLSEKKRGIIAGKAAQEEAKRQQLKRKGRPASKNALVYSQAAEIISHLHKETMIHGSVQPYDQGVLDAFLCLTGSRGAPDLYGKYIMKLPESKTRARRRKQKKPPTTCQAEVMAYDSETRSSVPGICGEPLPPDASTAFCSEHEA